MVNDERGSFSIPLALLFVALAIAAFGILGVLRNWRSKMTVQLEIDRCVGLAAQDLRDSLHRLGELNRAMVATRASLATVGNIPHLRAPLEAALEAETVAEDAIRTQWTVQSARWLAERGCRARSGDLPKPLPGLELTRPLPDSLGSKPLERDPGASQTYTIWLAHPPRYSAATVSSDDNPEEDPDDSTESPTATTTAALGASELPTDWQAQWSDPSRSKLRLLSP